MLQRVNFVLMVTVLLAVAVLSVQIFLLTGQLRLEAPAETIAPVLVDGDNPMNIIVRPGDSVRVTTTTGPGSIFRGNPRGIFVEGLEELPGRWKLDDGRLTINVARAAPDVAELQVPLVFVRVDA